MSSKPVPSSEDIRQKGNTLYKNGKVSEGSRPLPRIQAQDKQ
jgi:hypothetical protein